MVRSWSDTASAGPFAAKHILLIMLRLVNELRPMEYPEVKTIAQQLCFRRKARAAISPTYPVAERRTVNKVISGGQFILMGRFTVPKPRLV